MATLKLSLQYHKELNPVLWKNNTMKPKVREKLLEIAKKWQKFAKIPDSAIHDIVCTGGNCNFNYTPESDIDVHFLINVKQIPIKDPELLQDYMKAKKDLWALTHDIKVKGYDVELYAQDVNADTPTSQGVYSLRDDKWLVEPENLELNFDNDFSLRAKIKQHRRRIDSVIDNSESLEAAKLAKDDVTKLRGASIKEAGEFSIPNLIFKDLRNTGYLQKITDYINSKEDKQLSLESVQKQ